MSDQIDNNVRIWEQLGKTDPAHTKQFQRSGGFRGTAIKPMWCNLRMTEFFGPCGIGWGMEKPSFETREADKEMLVFCTVGVWYVENGTRGLVYGVGGDKYVISQRDGLRASDEAFKAAYTDAIGNAMKFIGVAADVHMGLFDDNKYVADMKAEFGHVDQGRTQVQPINQQLKASLAQADPANSSHDPADDELSFLNTDRHPAEEAAPPVIHQVKKNPHSVGSVKAISEKQAKRLWAIAKQRNISTDAVLRIIGAAGYETVDAIGWKDYEKIVAEVEGAA